MGARRPFEIAVEPVATNTTTQPRKVGADRAGVWLRQRLSLPEVTRDAGVALKADQGRPGEGAKCWVGGSPLRRVVCAWQLAVGFGQRLHDGLGFGTERR